MVWGGHEPKTESETTHCVHCTLNDHAEIGRQTSGTTQRDSWGDPHRRTGIDRIDQHDHPHHKWPPRNATDPTPYQGPSVQALPDTAQRCSQSHEFPANQRTLDYGCDSTRYRIHDDRSSVIIASYESLHSFCVFTVLNTLSIHCVLRMQQCHCCKETELRSSWMRYRVESQP